MGNFKEDIARCEAFVFDVDGVMTDGGIIPTPDGDFIRRYNAKDGYALAYAIKIGYKVCVITGGRGRTLENRLRMLGVPGRRRGRPRHRRAGAPRPRRLGARLAGRHALVARGVAVRRSG